MAIRDAPFFPRVFFRMWRACQTDPAGYESMHYLGFYPSSQMLAKRSARHTCFPGNPRPPPTFICAHLSTFLRTLLHTFCSL